MSLESRITTLEELESIRERVLEFFERCDNGGVSGETYDPEAMASLWLPQGGFESGFGIAKDRDELLSWFRDLAQTFSMHYAGNFAIDIEPGHLRATGVWNAWESPILSGKAVWGCFSHRHRYEKQDGEWYWAQWHQTEHFFAPVSTSWEDGVRVIEQSISKGA